MEVETENKCFQVVFLEPMAPALLSWLNSRGLYLYRIPLESYGSAEADLPTYGIGIKDEVAK